MAAAQQVGIDSAALQERKLSKKALSMWRNITFKKKNINKRIALKKLGEQVRIPML